MKRPRDTHQLLGKVSTHLSPCIPRGLPLTPALSQWEREQAWLREITVIDSPLSL